MVGMDTAQRLRLYYEACIPMGLLVLGMFHYGFPPFDDTTLTLVPGLLMCIIITYYLYDRLSSNTDDTHVLPGTQTSMYRRRADPGRMWGGMLVPLVMFALNIGDASDGKHSVGLGACGAWVLSVAMAWTFTVRLSGLSSGCSWALCVAGILALALAGPWERGNTGVHVCLVAMSAIAQHMGTQFVVRKLPRSFTLGEAAAIAQGICLALLDLAAQLFTRKQGLVDPQHMCVLVLEAAGVGTALIVCVLYMAPRHSQGVSVKDTVWMCVAAGAGAGVTTSIIAFVSGANPMRWIVLAVLGSQTGRIVLIYWFMLMTCATAIYAWCAQTPTSSSKLMLHIKRKSYHILAVLLFAPAYIATPLVLHIGFTIALCVFVCAESVRVLCLNGWGTQMTHFMRRFTDARDVGLVVTAHFYLLVGCAVPVWLDNTRGCVEAALAGVLALGVADTCASLVGLRFGSIKWPATVKTVEGTGAFIASLVVAVECMRWAKGFGYDTASGYDEMPGYGLVGSFVVCVAMGVLEALTDQNDNLVIPLTMYAAVKTLIHSDTISWVSVVVVAAMLAVPLIPHSTLIQLHSVL
ncbi:dolichol kinase [Coemansia sp. RSA 520]|nr:dolichol kinase [Coemansia sp. RSA 560]KAJ2194422.1 dolichol kinase [Coemansia sp. RSA 530]KAJ2196567.1 dolichol kinase [Coemansia sp. RSA 522]KAJ2223367.1 dolichol kinase [Coemansia sp. RSA 520]KAJ2289492.1 dolichol kinase [Coemansia sp. RSA 355]KAJ2434900.1 dolichol kinase [Coemansia sp. RSA 2522]KAJ2727293.1 dolichol kinase [Coemansia sp. D1744]